MNRPQSAKPGFRGNWGQNITQNIDQPTFSQKNPIRKQIKIMKPDLTTHDFARILPKKIQQDKQRLYSQALQLRQNLNEVTQENVRLKTKISILQREKDKINKLYESSNEGKGNKGSRINIYQSRESQKENMIIRNLKKIVRQSREENDLLKSENQKIKKMMKYTKINELEIERKVVIDQNKRLSDILQEYNTHMVDQQELQRQNSELKKYLQQELGDKQQIQQQIEKYQQIIESLQQKIRNQAEKYQNKEKKILRDLNTQRKKSQQFQKRNEQLTKQLKNLREQQNNASKIIIKANKNTKTTIAEKINPLKQQENSQRKQKYEKIKLQNQNLLKQLGQTKQKLKIAQQKIENLQSSAKIQKESTHLKAQIMRPVSSKKIEVEIIQKQLKETQKEQEKYYQNDEYEQQFQKEEPKVQQNKDQNIERYKKDFQQNQQQEEIYKREEEPSKNKNNTEQQQKRKDKKSQKNKKYKPDKAILAQIKDLLTYRMKAQRYPFKDIQVDIQSAQTSQFTYADLCNMFVNEPFYLTANYTKTFLSYCYQRQKIQASDVIDRSILIAKLRKVIDDFELMQQNEEKQMILRIAEMTSTYPRELQVAFENIRNSEQTVARKDLIQMFRKLELQDKYIELIIAELSLCSDDLEHLNYHGYFQRFYMQDENDEVHNNPIEQESEESYKHSSRIKHSARENNNYNENSELSADVDDHHS